MALVHATAETLESLIQENKIVLVDFLRRGAARAG